MANSLTLLASGVVKGGAALLYQVNVTKAGTGASSWTVYDNPSAASGRILAQGDGLTTQSFSFQGPIMGTAAATGLYLSLAGTTVPTITVTFD